MISTKTKAPAAEESNSENIPGGSKIYDFSQPKLISIEIIRAVRKIHETFAKNAKRLFTSALGHPVEVCLRDVEQVIFSKFLNSIESPSALFLFNIEEVGDWSILQMDPGFCIYTIERQIGAAEPFQNQKRALTMIEDRIMSRVIDKFFKDLSHNWSPLLPFTIKNHFYESKPANIRMISSAQPGIVVHFTATFDRVSVPFTLCYPYGELKEQLSSVSLNVESKPASVPVSGLERRKFEEGIKRSGVNLCVNLGTAKLPIKRIVDMNIGDVIMLEQHIENPLPIVINNKMKMTGYPGTINGKKGIKIFEFLKNEMELK